ncbi:MAG: lamin tail domain-containing protein, partial [Chiayiivirga sp.]|nr:lamin tail domain-containing protein [Chiayiivirga sp.]
MKNRLMTAVALALLGGGLIAGSSAFAAPGDTGASFDRVTTSAVTARDLQQDALQSAPQNAPAAIAPYCANTYTSAVEPITLVKINDIDNSSSNASTTAHEDFTAVPGTLRPGANYAVTMKSNTGGNFTHGHALYVDWNQDGDFDDAGEGYWIGSITNSNGTDAQEATAIITVPAGATLGSTRLRAMTAFNAASLSGLLPCRTGSGYGQSEDYTVTLDPGAAVPPFPPTMTMAFSPTRGTAPFTSTLSFAFGNADNGAPATLTADFVNTLPTGLEVATPSNATTTCSGTLTATDGAGSFTLASGGSIPDGGCTLSVDVSATVGGNYAYTVPAGALVTDMGDGPGAVAALTAIGGADSTSYATGFEAPFTVAVLNGQQGWAARTWTVSNLQPATDTQHLRTVSLASPTTSTNALAISPTFAIGTAPYATVKANIRLSQITNGASWRFNPQDPAANLVTTILQFERSATRNIQAISFDSTGNGTFVNTGAFWPVDAYFNIEAIVNRSTGALKLCLDGVQVYEDASGNGTAGLDIANVAISQATGTGQTANNTMLVDDLVVEYVNSYDCPVPAATTWSVTPSVGTPSGAISPNTAQTVNDGDTATFTLTPDAGFEIDTVGGTCGGTLDAGTSVYTTAAVTADCTVVANFKALPVTHTVTGSVGTPSGSISPSGAQSVVDGSTITFTATADAGHHFVDFTGTCPGLPSVANPVTTGAITADCAITANFAVDAAPAGVRISQVYGGGGGTGYYLHDYVELFNPGTSAVNLAGHSLQYGSATGQFGSSPGNIYAFPAGTSIAAGKYLLVQLSTPGTSGLALPAMPDLTTTNLTMSGTSGKVALANVAAALGCGATATPCALPHASIVDLAAFGGANNAEGGASINNGSALTNQQGGVRKLGGCQDTDNNNADFDVLAGVALVPRNSASPANTCGGPPVTHDVTPSVGTPSGSIAPNTVQTVNDGDTAAFTLTSDAGFEIDTVGGTCGGTLDAGTSVYTTAAVTADCTVVANFKAIVVPGDPIIDVTPASLSASQETNQTTT